MNTFPPNLNQLHLPKLLKKKGKRKKTSSLSSLIIQLMTRSLTTSSFATEYIFAMCYTTSVYSCSVAFVLPPDCFHFISASNLSSINSDMFLDLRKAIFVLFTRTIKVIFDNMNAGLCDQFCQDLV